ncbi:MAG: hypothetical protein ABI893_11620 [Polaromonas sp.]|uniref:hypothetical protein n=1 Tax=Polaromonas sp. TaxID=1869339 RepID=UPI003266240B
MTTIASGDAVQKLQVGQRAFDSTQQAAEVANGVGWSHDHLMFLTSSLLGFLSVVVLASTFLMWRQRSSADHMLRIFGIILIAGLSTFLLICGYSSAQLTPIVGLFGAIAGYLLGKDSGGQKTNPTENARHADDKTG